MCTAQLHVYDFQFQTLFRCIYFTDKKTQARIDKYTKRFKAADENYDGKLNLDEFVAFQHLDLFPRMHEVFVDEVIQPMDLNNDGTISFDEFKKG